MKRSTPEQRAAGEAKTMGDLHADHQEYLDRQAMTARCAVEGCDWRFDGTAFEARAAAEAHRLEAHPELRQLSRVERERKIREKRNADAAARAEMARQRDALAALDTGSPQPPSPPPPPPLRSPVPAPPVRPTRAEQDAARPKGMPPRWTVEKALAAIRAFHAEHGRPPALSDKRKPGSGVPSEGVARRLFGSWAAAIEAAGFERPSRGTSYRRLAERAAEAEPREPAAVPAPPVVYCVSCGATGDYSAVACPECSSPAVRPLVDSARPGTWGLAGLPIVDAPVRPQEPVSRPAPPPPVSAPIPAPVSGTRALSASRCATVFEVAAVVTREIRSDDELGLVDPAAVLEAVLLILEPDG